MKKKFVIVSLFIMIAIVLTSCAPIALNNKDVSTLSVMGKGEVYLVPDIAYINVGTRSEALEVTTALSENNKQAKTLADALTNMGIDPVDIQTTAFNVYPIQSYGMDGQPMEMKYVVENTVNVTVRDLPRLGEFLDTVVRSGANQIYGISFDVQDRKAAEAEARKLAVQDATGKAIEIAGISGTELGEVHNITVYSYLGGQPIYDGKGGGFATEASAPISAGQLLITAEANITYKLK